MATIKASDQITIVDVTDAYSVSLSSDSYTFAGTASAAKAGSTTTDVTALLGSNQVSASVTANEIVCPSGVTATVNQSGDYAGSPRITITVDTSVTQPGVVKIPIHVDDVTINKEFSYGIAFTGATGAAATSPYNYLIGNDSVVIFCDDSGAVSGAQSIVIPFSGWQGTARRAATITNSTLPTGMSVASGANKAATASADGSLTITVADAATLGDSNNGTITLSIKVNNAVTFTHYLTWAKVVQGTDGTNGKNGTDAVSPCKLTGGEASWAIPCTNGGLVKADTSLTVKWGGWQGVTRKAATLTNPTLPSGMSKTTHTNATASADGTLTLKASANGTLGSATTMSGQITLTYTIAGTTNVTETKYLNWTKVIDGKNGTDGKDGADAINLVITSSGGTIFKNSDVVTTLTAHIYKAGVEVTGDALTALGTIKWYKDGSTTAVGTGATLSITAGQVTNKAIYEAKLEA